MCIRDSSISSLNDQNIFTVKAKFRGNPIDFKFIDKFGRYEIANYRFDSVLYPREYACDVKNDYSLYFQGEEVTVTCKQNNYFMEMSSYSEKEFYFVDYSDGEKFKLITVSSNKTVEFSLTLPYTTDLFKSIFYIHQRFVEIPDWNFRETVLAYIYKSLQIDFNISEIHETKIKININTSYRIGNDYEVFYAIGPDSKTEGTEFHSLGKVSSFRKQEFEIPYQLSNEKYLMTIKILYANNEKEAKVSKVINNERTLFPLDYGKSKLNNSDYYILAGSTVILSPVPSNSSLQAYADILDKRYTLLKNNVVAKFSALILKFNFLKLNMFFYSLINMIQ